MSIKNRLDKLEALNTDTDYSKLTQNERTAQINILLAKRHESGCPNCNPCRNPTLCAQIEERMKSWTPVWECDMPFNMKELKHEN
ncbi:hypothetical protein KFZ76_04555 [Methylovulum psychrotolerans]|uniref:hypothetical protein n=1 Tax=Methylovulum psychrotolerans TaxID=1704499 RepID=UPI001BFFD395|nr:hypothetical protein [Methylovulum psychrotolerans]MBT9096984.1 hypothetical protein [Methylovulum psychrotolerans]